MQNRKDITVLEGELERERKDEEKKIEIDREDEQKT